MDNVINFGDILALAKAGFSRAEIALMLTSAPAEPEEKTDPAPAEPERKTDPAPAEPEKKDDPAPAEPEKKDDPGEGVNAEQMLAEILGLKRLIQTGNINNVQMPQTQSTAELADAALASIINPKKEDK